MIKRTLGSIFAILTVLVSTSCDNATRDVTGVPERAADLLDWRWAQPVSSLATTTAPATESIVTAVIGPKGGTIVNGEHVLVVPSKAVLSDTKFTFKRDAGSYISVDLTAARVSDGAKVSLFAAPLTLRLSYRGTTVSNPYSLVIAYLVDGTYEGDKQKLNSYVSTGSQTVTSYLTHFSRYAIGIE